MSIIQTIREKGAVIVIAVIAISLIGFILMDSMSGTGKLFGGSDQTTLGIVNGEKIEIFDFNEKVKEMEAQYPAGQGQRNQITQSAWDQMVAEKIVDDQFKKLGIVFTPKEMSAIMFSDEAPQQLKQAFTNKETGQYDVQQAQQWWAQMKKNKNSEQRSAIISQVIDPMRLNSLYSKYTSMIASSVYVPKWLYRQMDEEKNSFANISYVAVPYAAVSDSLVKIGDNDILDFLTKNEKKYHQEGGRLISYVNFSASANGADSQRILQSLRELAPQFATDSNAKFFLGRNSSAINFFDGYTPISKIQIPSKDSIIALSDGGVFGPYLDGKNYTVAKKLATKMLPDSIKCRHILIGTVDPQSQQPRMDDSTAHRLADSIQVAIQNGASFDSLSAKYSTDEAAKKDNGVMTFDLMTIQGEGFAKEFGKFLLNEKGENKKVVKTEFGYHYIEILNKINPEPAYKIAYMSKEIAPSDATINEANTAAVKLSGTAKDVKSFNEYVAKKGLTKIDVPTVIKENDYQLGGLQDARSIIKWAFDSKEGAVSDPITIKDDFIVAVVDKRVKDGLPDVQMVRAELEPLIRNKKKSGIIIKKLGNPSSLESAAQAYNVQVLQTGADSTLTFSAQIINGVGNEPKVAGASFNKDFQTKVSPPIPGNTGVFVIKVNSVSPKAPLPPGLAQQQQTTELSSQVQSALGQSFNSLKKMAEISDYRSKFF